MNQKTCIIICGPTASGKTAVAIEVAKHFNTHIISADSRQCFTELGVAVAKPSQQELNEVKHHFINSHSIQQNFNAANYESFALQTIEKIFVKNSIAVMVGGTGLYIKAFTDGLDEILEIPEKIKQEIVEAYKIYGIKWLQNSVKQEDELFFETGEIQNPHRLIRALEVKRASGKSILQLQKKIKKQRDFNIVKIGVELERTLLYQNINTRVDQMLNNGLLEEAKLLYQYKHLNALQTVGYRELFDAFENKISIEKAIELIKQNTRHYAKRQLTWFKKDSDVNWQNSNVILDFCKNFNRNISQ